MKNQPKQIAKLYSSIKELVNQAHAYVVQNVNTTIVFTYYHIGRMIVEEEQRGKIRAKYAAETLKSLSEKLTKEFGKGFTKRNLELMRKFYLTYAKTKSLISQSYNTSIRRRSSGTTSKTAIAKSPISQFKELFKLTWTHYVVLMRIEDEAERNFYEIETVNNNWSVRELERQYNASLYERLALSRDKKKVIKLSTRGQRIEKPIDMLKRTYVLEFLRMKEEPAYTESQLESAIIQRIEEFMLELGKGFLFQNRQCRISMNAENYYIDLVFYNRLLKCFVLIDLKIGKLTHQDIGQMQMYVNFYDREVKFEIENKTIGIILCKQTNKAVIEFTLPKGNDQIFAREYKLYLPSKKELQKLLCQ